MLAIRMQRTGRKGHAQFRVVVQDSRRTPTSGKIVVQLGYYDPHTKQTILDKEKASFYLSNGAQPSKRVISLLKGEKVTIPAWAELSTKKTGKIRHPEKLRRNQPKTAEQPEEKPAAPEASDEPAVEVPAADDIAGEEQPDDTSASSEEVTTEEA